jgi:hypothetical protein
MQIIGHGSLYTYPQNLYPLNFSNFFNYPEIEETLILLLTIQIIYSIISHTISFFGEKKTV